MTTDEPTLTIERSDAPTEVAAFVAAVRSHLRDLPVEEQQELTEGLAADLEEQLADGGADDLGDPAAYARELRVAAGFSPVGSVRRSSGQHVSGLLDASRARWDRVWDGSKADPRGLLETLAPVWWVVRGWALVALVETTFGSWPYDWVPSGPGPLGWIATVAVVLVSVQVGRRRLWPGTALPGVLPRILLLLANVFLALILLPVASQLPSGDDVVGATNDAQAWQPPGLMKDGMLVENVYPYDAEGHPLTGVQLYDQDGRPLSVTHDPGWREGTEEYVVRYPWRNGSARAWNVFPLPERLQDSPVRSPDAFSGSDLAHIVPPMVRVAPVSIEGFLASIVTDPKAEARPAAGPSPTAGPTPSPAAR